MATFYTDTGSLGRLEVTGSTILSSSIGGTLQIQGSGSNILSILGSKGSLLEISDTAGTGDIFTIQSASIDVLTVDSNKNVNISGSLTITGSLVLTQVLAGTASYATTASSADFLDGYHASSFTLNSQTASMNVLSSSYAATASLLLGSVVSASYALSASWAPGGAGASPGGTTGEIQFNDGGSFGGSANVEIREGNLNLVSTSDPATNPTGSITLYSKDIAGRQILKWIGPSGVDTPAQPNIMFNQVSLIGPGGGTTVGVVNCTVTSVGTVSNPNIATTNLKTQTRRIVNTSAATAGALASTRIATLECWRGNAAGRGGFFVLARFGMTTLAVGQRMFIGLDSNATAAPTNIDYLTSTTNAKIGMYATGSTAVNWNLIHNAAASAPTTIPLGANFPVNNTDLYEMVLFAKPNDTAVSYRITNLSTVVQVSGSLTTNLPASTALLGRLVAGCNNATAAAVAWDVSRFGLETDY